MIGDDILSFQSNRKNVLEEVSSKLDAAAEEIREAMESHAKLYITVGVYQSPEGKYIRTGNLRNNITAEVKKEKDKTTIVVGTPVEYAPWVELGTGIFADGGRKTPWRYQDEEGNWHTTSGMPPRPYLRPAVENHTSEYRQILQDYFQD